MVAGKEDERRDGYCAVKLLDFVVSQVGMLDDVIGSRGLEGLGGGNVEDGEEAMFKT